MLVIDMLSSKALQSKAPVHYLNYLYGKYLYE